MMWRDIGLDDWLFDLDQPEETAKIAPTALRLAQDQPWAKRKAIEARAFVEKRQEETMALVANPL